MHCIRQIRAVRARESRRDHVGVHSVRPTGQHDLLRPLRMRRDDRALRLPTHRLHRPRVHPRIDHPTPFRA